MKLGTGKTSLEKAENSGNMRKGSSTSKNEKENQKTAQKV